jgi:hypothetical protein
MPLHIKRLIITFAVFVAIFLVLKHFLTPVSFKEFGHYRGLSIQENENREVKHVGMKSCAPCHDGQEDTIMSLKASGLHESLACEGCHGPGYKHIKAPDKEKLFIPSNVRDFCGVCHGKNAARPKDMIKTINLKEHHKEDNCTKCHNPHEPWQ